ncbi:hypothetical protein SAMN02787100_2054 [Chryseobacterium sp. OV279]|nr:hypothetical protein SAMN02787100_2054 [Chryseobacterium sp. OV279]
MLGDDEWKEKSFLKSIVNFAAQVNGQLMADSKIQNPKSRIQN